MKSKSKETLEQKVLRERKLKELSFEVDSLIVKIVKGVEEINSLKGIGEVKVGTKHFEESHEVIRMLGYDDSFDIVRFRIPLNKVGKLALFWNPRQELIHKYCLFYGCLTTKPNLEATVEMYENLITLLNSSSSKLEDEKSKLGGK